MKMHLMFQSSSFFQPRNNSASGQIQPEQLWSASRHTTEDELRKSTRHCMDFESRILPQSTNTRCLAHDWITYNDLFMHISFQQLSKVKAFPRIDVQTISSVEPQAESKHCQTISGTISCHQQCFYRARRARRT